MISEADRALESGSGCVVGAIDADGAPFAARAWSITLSGPGCSQARVVVSADPRIDQSIVGRRIAVTATDVPTLVSRQLKGPVVAVGDPSEDDLEAMSRQTVEFLQAIHDTDGNPISRLRRFLPADVVLVEMTVEELYDQTPGPSAGGMLSGAP